MWNRDGGGDDPRHCSGFVNFIFFFFNVFLILDIKIALHNFPLRSTEMGMLGCGVVTAMTREL